LRGKNRNSFAAAVANALFVLASRRAANKTIPTQRIVRQHASLVGRRALFEHSSLDFSCVGEIVQLAAAMDEQSDKEIAGKKQRDQMLKLVAKGFYNELTNYGVRKHEIIQVASHLLDNLLAQEKKPAEGVEYYNAIFTLASVKDEWVDRKQLAIQHVTLRPLQLPDVSKVAAWLEVPAVRESFVPAFPESESQLRKYFTHPTREYFGVYYNDQPVGIVGGENIDLTTGKLEMKKLVGESGLQGKGIGKRGDVRLSLLCFHDPEPK
jgi:hypothetical protein